MDSRIVLVTCTGDRHAIFQLCERWMARQTVPWDEWYVVDDGKVPTKPTLGQKYIPRERRADDPEHTLICNLECLPSLKGRVFFIEDDDHYTSDHIETHLKYDAPLIGQRNPCVYKLSTRQYRQHKGNGKATALASSSVDGDWRRHLPGDAFLDKRLYANMPYVLYSEITTTGVKNYPVGRQGVCQAHGPKGWGRKSPNFVFGADTQHYLPFLETAQ